MNSSSFLADISGEYPQYRDEKIIYFDSAGRSVLPASVEREGYEALKYNTIKTYIYAQVY